MEQNFKLSIRNADHSRFFRTSTHLYQKSFSAKVLNEKGQAIVIAFVILPLLFAGLMYFMEFLDLLYTKMKTQKQCRTYALEAQKEIIKGFKELQELNPQAQRLRASARSAKRALAAAQHPAAKAIALTNLAYVKSLQMALATRQQTIIKKSQSNAKIEIYKIKGQNYKGLPPFELKRTPLTSLSPSYIKPAFLSRKQEIIVKWQVKNNFNQSMEGQCGSHVKSTPTGFQAKYSYPDTL